MNRRSFLSTITTAVGLLAINPEELLWKPTKKIFVPAPSVYGHAIVGAEVKRLQQQWDSAQSNIIDMQAILNERFQKELEDAVAYDMKMAGATSYQWPVWPIEEISKHEMLRRYPSSK